MKHILRRAILALVLIAGFAPAFAQIPPPVPALPDTERRTTYNIAASTCSCAVNFALYGDSTDYQNWVEVFINGVRYDYNDASHGWTITSPSGSLSSLPRPITNAVLTFTAAQTGTVQIVGARRPRRASQFNENAGVPTRNFNQVLTDIISQNREIWDKTNDVTGRALMSQPGVTTGLLPLPSVCVNGFLGFDGTGSTPVCRSTSGTGNVNLPVVSGNLACFDGTTGFLRDCGTPAVNLVIATQAEAEAGTRNDVLMTPLRTVQAGTLPRGNRTFIKAVNTAASPIAYLSTTDVDGFYRWAADTPIALHQSDPSQTDYIAPNPAAVGAWVRRQSTNPNDFAAFTPIKRKILLNSANVKVLVLSDSTGVHPDGQIYLFFTRLAPIYPTHTVRIIPWDTATGNYGTPVVLQTGYGTANIDVYLAAVSGFNFVNWLGARFANAVVGIDADLILLNLGLNVAGPASQPIALRSFMDGIQSVMAQKPGTPIAMHLQQPFQDTNGMAVVNGAQRQIKAMMPGISLVDSYSKFVRTGKPLSWYAPADNTHTSAIGTSVQVQSWMDAWNAAGSVDPPADAFIPWISSAAATNLLYNGDFTDGVSYLTSWTTGGTGTFSRDTVEKFTGKSASAKIVNTNGAYIKQTFDAAQLVLARGRTLTFMARRRIVPSAVSSFAGTMEIQVNGKNNPGVIDSFHFNADDGSGGYFITVVAGVSIPIDAGTVSVAVFASGNTDAATVNVDEVWCYFGSGPPAFPVLYN